MKIIDRYLLRQFLKSFCICFISLTGLYIVFDAFTNLEAFSHVSDKMGGLLWLMLGYYAYRSVLFFDIISPMLTLVSAMFTITWIQRHNEFTALMSAGISRVRVVMPIIVASVILAGLAALNREVVMPRMAGELSKSPKNLEGKQAEELKMQCDNTTEVLIKGKAAYSNEKRIEQPNFWLPPPLDRYGSQLMADNAFYMSPQEGRPGGYWFKGVTEPKNLDAKPSLLLDGRPVIITPRDAPGWLSAGQCFVVSDVDFDLLMGATTFRLASTRQLIAGLRRTNAGYGADVRVTIHSRIIQPLLDVTLLFLGLPLVVSRQSRNVFFAIGLCLCIVTIFMMVTMGLQSLGSNSLLPAAFAAWAPLMIFGPIAFGLADSMRQ